MPARNILVLICLALIVIARTSLPGAAQGPAMPGEDRGDRGTALDELTAAERRWLDDGTDPDITMSYATLLLEAGQFERSRDVVEPLLQAADTPLDAVLTAARLDYFMGDYVGSEALYNEVLSRDPENRRALTGLVFTYYQTNAYHRCAELPQEALADVRLPHLDVMLAFGQETPWRISWDDAPQTEVPFLETDPLPVIEVEIEGLKIAAIVDTGGDLFILDTETAESLGMARIASMMGMFAGGMQAEIGFARADSLRVGGATLHAVPISILPTRGLSLGERQIEGIVGTAVLRQFLSTMDFPRGRLVLRERSESSLDEFQHEVAGRVAEEVPFYLQSSHFLLAHGSLNGHQGLLFHVDSGLAGEPAFAAPRETMEYLHIPIPEMAVHEGVVGGGGGGFATGTFPIAELGLGRLVRRDLVGTFGGQPPGSYWHMGFIVDGLISHNFLRDYAWTLDFDRMRMVLVE
ncbi:MAG: aspartyl protease family protein [Candidatus Eisenbacteria bacterium]|nr:aspartyl protease family protein [Candidatus Eisenbacteria bacterium]